MDKLNKKKRNFFMTQNEIFEIGLGPYELAVYFYLNRLADNSTSEAFPSYPTIAKKCGMGRTKAYYAVETLIEKELLLKQPRIDETGQTSNLYTVLDPPELSTKSDGGSPHERGPVHDMNGGSAPHERGPVHDMNSTNTNYKNTYIEIEPYLKQIKKQLGSDNE